MCGENEHLKKGELSMLKVIKGEDFLYIIRSVSYTHLTLPTIYSV